MQLGLTRTTDPSMVAPFNAFRPTMTTKNKILNKPTVGSVGKGKVAKSTFALLQALINFDVDDLVGNFFLS